VKRLAVRCKAAEVRLSLTDDWAFHAARADSAELVRSYMANKAWPGAFAQSLSICLLIGVDVPLVVLEFQPSTESDDEFLLTSNLREHSSHFPIFHSDLLVFVFRRQMRIVNMSSSPEEGAQIQDKDEKAVWMIHLESVNIPRSASISQSLISENLRRAGLEGKGSFLLPAARALIVWIRDKWIHNPIMSTVTDAARLPFCDGLFMAEINMYIVGRLEWYRSWGFDHSLPYYLDIYCKAVHQHSMLQVDQVVSRSRHTVDNIQEILEYCKGDFTLKECWTALSPPENPKCALLTKMVLAVKNLDTVKHVLAARNDLSQMTWMFNAKELPLDQRMRCLPDKVASGPQMIANGNNFLHGSLRPT